MDENKKLDELAEAAGEQVEPKVEDAVVEAEEIAADIAVAQEKADEAAEIAEREAVEKAIAAEETAEEVTSEEIANTAEAAEEIAEEHIAEVAEGSAAAEEISANAAEIGADILAAGSAVEAEELEEEKAAEEALDAEVEKAEVIADTEKTSASVKEPPIIKKKKKLDKTNVIVIVVCAVIVLACLAFVGYKSGWFTPKQKAKIEVGDYSKIEVLKDAVAIDDATVEQYITNILQTQSETKQVTEGIVAEGDQLNIDYVGKLASTGEAFEGGTATGQSLTIGSGMMIDGFESGLIGAEIGKTKTINVVFPADYQSTALAGQPATFDVTINYKSETVAPELTDEFVKNYSSNYLEKQLNTVEELEEYVHDYIYNYYLHTAMFEDIQSKEKAISYDEEAEAMLIQYSMDSLDYYAGMYGTTPDEYAVMYGYTDANAYATEEAHYYLDTIMLVDKIIKDKKITWTDEELDQSIALYMARNGYSERYTVEEFKTQSGDTWLYLYENLEFKFDLAMEALEDDVVFVDQKTETETSSEAASTETETTTK